MSHREVHRFECDWCHVGAEKAFESVPDPWVTIGTSYERPDIPGVREHASGEFCSVACADKWWASQERGFRLEGRP